MSAWPLQTAAPASGLLDFGWLGSGAICVRPCVCAPLVNTRPSRWLTLRQLNEPHYLYYESPFVEEKKRKKKIQIKHYMIFFRKLLA